MKTYKAHDNSLHSLSAEDIANGGEKYLPAGCVEITKAEADEIRAASVPKPTHAELVASVLAKARQQRLPILSILDGLQASALTASDLAKAQAIEAAKQGLRDITSIDLSVYQTQAEMEQAVFTAYVMLAAQAPASVQSAFQSIVP